MPQVWEQGPSATAQRLHVSDLEEIVTLGLRHQACTTMMDVCTVIGLARCWRQSAMRASSSASVDEGLRSRLQAAGIRRPTPPVPRSPSTPVYSFWAPEGFVSLKGTGGVVVSQFEPEW